MSNKRILLFVMAITFLIIGVSAVSAADASGDDIISSSDISQNVVDNSINTQTIVKEESSVKTAGESDNSGSDVTANDKIVKNEQNIKAAPKTIVINSNTIDNYFNYDEDNLGLKSGVSAGDTLDFQGNIDRPGKILVIDKPVNVTASKGNSRIYLNTTAQSYFGDEDLPCLMFTQGASYSNVSGIYLYNTQLYVKHAHHITFNNISTKVENQRVGSGVGQTSIRDNSSYIVVENSTFTTENNGGSSTFVLAWASHCTIRNNLVTGIGEVGNLIYLTTYNVEGINENVSSADTLNSYNVIDNNTIYGPSNPSSIRWGIVICGKSNVVTNNKIYYNGTGITQQYMADGRSQSINTTIRNNELYGASLYCPEGGIVVNNTVYGNLTPAPNTQIYNNTANNVNLLSNVVFANNTINGNVTIPANAQNVTLANCTVNGNISVRAGDSSSSIPKNITLQNLQINGAVEVGSNGAVDTFTVKNNNITDGILLSGKRNNQVKNVIIENNIINSDDEYAVNVNRTVTNVTIKNNRINSTDKVGNDAVLVKNEGNDVTILNNSAPQKTTEIVLNNVASSVYANQNITFTGTFKVEGKAAKATKIGVYDNNSKLTDIETNDNGVFNYTYKTSKTGQHNISFRFAQNDTLYASNASKTITVNSPIATSITLTGDSSVYCNENLVISGTFKANNAAVKVNSIDVYDGSTKLATVTSGNDGKFNYTFKSATVGSHNLVFKFAGNVSHQASNATKTVTVNKIPTTITVVANPTSVYLTENIAFNATFKANNAAVKVNSIDVYDGSTKLATVGPSANNGVVSYTYTAAKAGSHNITFKFAGNATHLASNATKTITVNNPIATSITLTGDSSVYCNENLVISGTFKANNAAVKVNSIDVYDGSTKLATVSSGNDGKFNYTFKSATVGSHNLVFKFAGNVSHQASNATKTVTVNKIPTTITVVANPTSAIIGENIVFNATFKANNAAVKVNSVDVYDGSTKLATVGPSGTNGVVSYTYTAAKAGSHNITFKFVGNATHLASNATKTVTVNKIPTSISIVANPTSVYVTENIAFNATFKANNAAVKVNSIDVYEASTKLATVGPSANNGVVSYTYTAAKAGSHDITFKFAGNATHLASEATKTITVKDPATTSITLTSDRTSVYLTEKANITGTFKEGNKAIKVDSITVTDNGKQVATVGPSGSDGVFNYIFDGTAAGNHNLTFKFAGNVSHNASQSSIIINVDAPNATSIQLTTNASELFVDQTAKLDALFTLAGQSTGTYVEEIAITDNGEQIATVGPSSDGKLTYEYQAKEIGNHEITFKFAGNVSHVASEYTINILVKEPDATQITLTSDKDSLYVDQTAKLDAEFAYADQSTGTYVESITITDNGEQIATVGPLDDGKVTYDYVASEVGIHEITFSFAGNNTHAAAESTINIEVKAPDATEIQLTVDGETEFNESESSVISGVFKYANEDEGTYVDLITICEDDVEIATAGPSDDGTFTYTYTPQKPGDHVLTFSFAGNNTHAAAESSINYHIRGYVLKVDTTEFIKGQPATIQASIYFEGQVSEDINKGKVAFKVNGKTLKDESGKTIYAKIVNGVAKIEDYVIPESWADGNYSIQAVSTASSQSHALKSELSTLNVHEEEDPTIEEPQLTTEDVTATIGTPVTLKATLTDNGKQINEGKVLFKVNGKTLKDESGKVIYAKIVNNEAVLEYTFPESWKLKDYTITAMLISSDYPRLEANSTLTLSD